MCDEQPRLYFDFVDPGSLLMQRRVAAVAPKCGLLGFEMRPPPEPLVEAGNPAWRAYWDDLAPALRDVGWSPGRPTIVPWTRKAHELVLQGTESGVGGDLRERLFRAFLESGSDIGRIDVLLRLAVEVGLDATETKAVLDVDRWRDEVEKIRAHALTLGVRGVPTLVLGDRRLEGVHHAETIREFLGDGRSPKAPDQRR